MQLEETGWKIKRTSRDLMCCNACWQQLKQLMGEILRFLHDKWAEQEEYKADTSSVYLGSTVESFLQV